MTRMVMLYIYVLTFLTKITHITMLSVKLSYSLALIISKDGRSKFLP
jgi:hypothetical protein